MKTKYTLIISLLFTIVCFSQPEIEWQKSLGGTGMDNSYSIQQTADGGYIIAGFSDSNDGDVTDNNGEEDFWVVKLSSTGDIEWQKSLGGSYLDFAFSIKQTVDEGYIVVGTSESNDGDVTGNHGSLDFWVVKLTSIGDIDWQKSLGGSSVDSGESIQQTLDGGYIVSGYSYSIDGDVTSNNGWQDIWVVKLSSTGTIIWQNSFGGSYNEISRCVRQTSDGGYIIGGLSGSNDGDVTDNNGEFDYWVVKLTATGDLDWQKSMGGTGEEEIMSIQQTLDGGYIVAGWSNSNDGDVSGNHGDEDCWVVKLTTTGVIDWQKSLGGSDNDSGRYVQQTIDGGFIVAGISESIDNDVTGNHGEFDYWAVKLTTTGDIDWQKSLGGSDIDYAVSIQQTAEEGYIVGGMSKSNDGDVTGNHGDFDYWVVKLSPVLGVNDFNIETAKLYPNPTTGKVTIEAINLSEIKIYDSLGKLSFSKEFESEHKNTINLSHLAKGVYTMIITTLEGEETKKLILK
jgi:hypothetical protein